MWLEFVRVLCCVIFPHISIEQSGYSVVMGHFGGGVVVIFAYGFVVFTRTAIIAFFKNVFKNSSLDFRERGKERERELEKYPLVASHMHPDRGSNLQPSCVP